MSKDPAVQDERQRERQRMRKLLQEYEDACDRGVGPEADADDDLERFRGDLDAVSYARLSAGERERFAKALQDGSLMRLVQLWEPWWAQQGSLLVEELGEEARDAAVPVSLAELRSLERPAAIQLGRRALENAAIRYQAVDLIAAYACAMRIVNGEADEETLGEFVKLAVALSPTLVDIELRYSGRTHLVEVLGENRKRNQVLTLGAAGSQRDLLEDARQICATRNGCLVAVRHLKVLFDRLVDNFDRMKAEGGDVDHGVKQTKKLARRASKKIEYHFFWLREATRNMIARFTKARAAAAHARKDPSSARSDSATQADRDHAAIFRRRLRLSPRPLRPSKCRWCSDARQQQNGRFHARAPEVQQRESSGHPIRRDDVLSPRSPPPPRGSFPDATAVKVISAPLTLLPNLSLVDAFYLTGVSITTIGYGDFAPQDPVIGSARGARQQEDWRGTTAYALGWQSNGRAAGAAGHAAAANGAAAAAAAAAATATAAATNDAAAADDDANDDDANDDGVQVLLRRRPPSCARSWARTLIFSLAEGWTLHDAAWFSYVTCTTVGYGDISVETYAIHQSSHFARSCLSPNVELRALLRRKLGKVLVVLYSIATVAPMAVVMNTIGQHLRRQLGLGTADLERGHPKADIKWSSTS
eukprot:scaffold1085_cov252-Pinguiococcus_pyrenoidosus.AAC.11